MRCARAKRSPWISRSGALRGWRPLCQAPNTIQRLRCSARPKRGPKILQSGPEPPGSGPLAASRAWTSRLDSQRFCSRAARVCLAVSTDFLLRERGLPADRAREAKRRRNKTLRVQRAAQNQKPDKRLALQTGRPLTDSRPAPRLTADRSISHRTTSVGPPSCSPAGPLSSARLPSLARCWPGLLASEWLTLASRRCSVRA